MIRLRFGLLFAILILGGVSTAHAQTNGEIPQMKESDRAAPIDWGYGPGVKPSQVVKQPPKTGANTSKAGTPQSTTSQSPQGDK